MEITGKKPTVEHVMCHSRHKQSKKQREIAGENQPLSMSCAMVAINSSKWGLKIDGHHLRKLTVEHVMCHGRHIRYII